MTEQKRDCLEEMRVKMGRPRKYDRDQVALMLLDWAFKEDSLNLNGFCGEILITPSKITEWAREENNFRLAYETAKAIISERREQKLNDGELHVKAYDLNASVYDHFLKMERREFAQFESLLKSQTENNVDEGTKAHIEALLFKLDKMQRQSSARKMADSNISIEPTS